MTLRPALLLSFVLAACDRAPSEVAVITAPACIEHSPTLWGIDVSKWQGTIDWAKVKAAGVEYAFIRVSDGVSTIDEQFPANWTGAAAQGIPRGVYQFFRPNRDAVEQAQIVIDHLDLYGMGELPPVIDVEATGDQTPEVVAQKVGQWVDTIETTLGVRPIVYSGSYFWDDNVKTTAFSDYPFWIAHYTSAACPRLPAAWADWTFWQYSSSGSVSGIAGNVDMNRFAGDRATLLSLVPDETCRLEPDWVGCEGDALAACVDGQVDVTACAPGTRCSEGGGPHCVDTRCVDALGAESGTFCLDADTLATCTRGALTASACGSAASCVAAACVGDTPEPVESGPEAVEPAPEPQPEIGPEPEPEPSPELGAEVEVHGTIVVEPSRTVSLHEVSSPSNGCAGGGASWLGLVALAWSRPHKRASKRRRIATRSR